MHCLGASQLFNIPTQTSMQCRMWHSIPSARKAGALGSMTECLHQSPCLTLANPSSGFCTQEYGVLFPPDSSSFRLTAARAVLGLQPSGQHRHAVPCSVQCVTAHSELFVTDPHRSQIPTKMQRVRGTNITILVHTPSPKHAPECRHHSLTKLKAGTYTADCATANNPCDCCRCPQCYTGIHTHLP